MKVSLFVTCLTDTFYPRVGQAVVAVLERLGCQIDFPQAQTCCGQPMFNSGFSDDARELAKRMIEVFEHAEYVVTPSGSCCAMIHDYYPQLLGKDPQWADRTNRFVHKTYEFVDFLTRVKKVDLAALGCTWEGRLTYHYSCHLRGLGMTDEATQLLDQIRGVDRVELTKRDQCCGFGGTFAVKYPEISGAMVRDKVACIEKTGVPFVVCNDGGCAMNIDGAAHRKGSNVKLLHIAEIIAESMGLLERSKAAR